MGFLIETYNNILVSYTHTDTKYAMWTKNVTIFVFRAEVGTNEQAQIGFQLIIG